MAISLWQIKENTRIIANYPTNVILNAQELLIRQNGLQNILPVLLSAQKINVSQALDVLKGRQRSQQANLEAIQANYLDDPHQVKLLSDAFNKLCAEQENAVLNLSNDDTHDLTEIQYLQKTRQAVSTFYSNLHIVMAAAEYRASMLQATMNQKIDLTLILTVIFGILIASLLIYFYHREQIRNSEIISRERLFGMLAQNVNELFIIAKDAKNIEYVSPNSDRLLNIPSESLKREPDRLLSILPKEDSSWLHEILSRKIRLAGPSEHDLEDDINGISFKLRIYPLCRINPHNKRFIVALSDQTKTLAHQRELDRALSEAKAINSAKNRFFSNMSHEIRTPINAIIGMTTIALSKINDIPRVADCLHKVDASSRHLLGLINAVLDMSKIESGKMTLDIQPFNLGTTLLHVESIIAVQARTKELTFNIINHAGKDLELLGDQLRINQILINLISNSLKFTNAGGKIELVVNQIHKDGNRVVLRFVVQDNGIGMNKEALNRIFKPFEQASASTSSKYGGTGLGLSITASFVELMGGKISVDSIEGQGTSFTIDIPFELMEKAGEGTDTELVSKDDEEIKTAKTGTISAADEIKCLEGKRILLVEDNEFNREIGEEFINMFAAEAEVAENGEEAVHKFADSNPGYYDLILMDVQMPIMNGYEATAKIRKLERADAGTIPIIALTANAFNEDIANALSHGMNDHLAKPVDIVKLRLLLQKYLCGDA